MEKLIYVLQDEIEALETWKKAKGLPKDVREGIEISISKIETALSDAGVKRRES